MFCKVKSQTEIYIREGEGLYFLGSSPSIKNRTSFTVLRDKSLIPAYKIHNVLVEGEPLDIVSRGDILARTSINRSLIARNYIWNISKNSLEGYRYTIIRGARILRLDEARFRVEASLFDRQEKYIYL